MLRMAKARLQATWTGIEDSPEIYHVVSSAEHVSNIVCPFITRLILIASIFLIVAFAVSCERKEVSRSDESVTHPHKNIEGESVAVILKKYKLDLSDATLIIPIR